MPQLQIPTDRPPIFISAGVNKEEAQIVHAAVEETLALQVVGAYSELEWAGGDENGRRNVTYWDEEQQAFYNSVQLKNPGRKKASEYLPKAIKVAHDAGQLVVISVVALKHENPFKVLPGMSEWALEMGADGVEVDGGCRNQDPSLSLLCDDVERSYALFENIRSHVGASAVLGYKVAPLARSTINRYVHEGKLQVDFIDTINALSNQPCPINPKTEKPFVEVNDGLAAMSGPIIKGLARMNLEGWLGYDVDLTIPRQPKDKKFQMLTCGGVVNGREGYYRTHHMGADLAGAAQIFTRSRDIRRTAQRMAQEYVAVAA